jgi:hypothetical protein
MAAEAAVFEAAAAAFEAAAAAFAAAALAFAAAEAAALALAAAAAAGAAVAAAGAGAGAAAAACHGEVARSARLERCDNLDRRNASYPGLTRLDPAKVVCSASQVTPASGVRRAAE